MEISRIDVAPHPQLLEALFAFKSKVSSVFKDVLGIYEIHHIAIAQLNKQHQIINFSSTPALEFNLFNSNLWLYDKSYHFDWLNTCSQADWQSLYASERYDELYYLKQIKHHYPIGYSLATKIQESLFLYSFASNRSCHATREIFANQHENFYKIGLYCTEMLQELFQHYNEEQTLPPDGNLQRW